MKYILIRTIIFKKTDNKNENIKVPIMPNVYRTIYINNY